MAGLNVGGSGAGSVFDRAGRWLDRVKTGPNGSQFQYQPGTGPTPTMSAAGLLCRQYLHAKRTDPMMVDGVKYLMQNLPDLTVHNVYYWYYATQVLHNYTGYEWDTWNRAMRKLLITTQTKSSNLRQWKLGPGQSLQGPVVAPGRPAHDHGAVLRDAGDLLPLSAAVQEPGGLLGLLTPGRVEHVSLERQRVYPVLPFRRLSRSPDQNQVLNDLRTATSGGRSQCRRWIGRR